MFLFSTVRLFKPVFIKFNFNRALKSNGGSVGSLMDGSLNQPLKIDAIDTIQSLRSMYQNGGLAQLEILDLLKKIDLKDLNSTELKLIKELTLEDK